MIPYSQRAPYFAQWGEDRWLAEHLAVPARGVFVDVGAGDGVRGSNSRFFEDLGWTGLCVDPDPRNHEVLAERRCAVRACAVASQPGQRTFSLYDHKPSWSGLGDRGDGYTTITVECRRLDDLLAEVGIGRVDLLSIDVEGDEMDVWSSFGEAHTEPGILIVEYDDDQAERSTRRIIDILGVDRYELLHRTPANLILRSRSTLARRRWPRA